MQYTILMVGKTHSGKTTFGKQLMKELEDNAMLFDSDELTDFLMEKYPWLQKKIFPSELPTPLGTPSIALSLLSTMKQISLSEESFKLFCCEDDFIKTEKALHSIIRLFLLDTAMRIPNPLILTSAHMRKDSRSTIYEMMRSQGRKVILVYLKYSEEFLLQRIKNTDRETTILTTSSTWENLLLEKQRQIFEAPTSEEADYFFEITDEDSLQQAKKEILNLL